MIKIIINSFKNAFVGILSAVKSERHMRVHIVSAAYVLWFSSFYSFTKTEYGVILAVIALVISSEMFNTAIEDAVDLASPSYHKKAKRAKDTAAGAVLISAIIAAIIGIMFFIDLNVLTDIFNYFKSSLMRVILLFVSIVFSILFIFTLFKPKNIATENKEKR